MTEKKLILASASPRRREILESAGYVFDILSPDCDEASDGLSPADLAVENSRRKAMAALDLCSGIVISADTVVTVDERILGKPGNEEKAKEMLRLLSDKPHSVITGYTVTDGEKTVSGFEETRVFMRYIHDDEINSYVSVCRPLDKASGRIGDSEKSLYPWEGKAGGYGIQDPFGMRYVKRIEGDYYSVMGLPISCICEILKNDFGIEI